MQHFLKPASGAAGAKVVTPKFFLKRLVAVHNSDTPFDLGLGWVSPSSVCSTCQKQGRFSNSVFLVMEHLLMYREREIVANPQAKCRRRPLRTPWSVILASESGGLLGSARVPCCGVARTSLRLPHVNPSHPSG